jgi:hypothetical protein
MLIRITSSFVSPLSPRPLITGELIDVTDDLATQWITENKAMLWTLSDAVAKTPPKQKREKAVRH